MTTQYLSVCSGIEAASVAWHPLGWKPLAFAEIEAFPRAVLEHRWPGVPVHGDFTRLRDETWIVDADVLVGGTPCQAFSVAGKRASLADDRGNLTLEFVRLAEAIDDVRRLEGRDPSILIWENVPGVLSVKDNAFGCFLAALAGEDEALVPPRGKWANAGVVVGPQRSVAWRILDAQYFGVAQRRRRVFVVASARDGFNPAEVLLEWEGVRRDTPPSREAGEGVAGSAGPSAAGGGVPSVSTTLRGEGFDASEDGTGRGTPLVPVAFHPTQDPISSTDGSTHTLSSGSKRGTATVAVAFQTRGSNLDVGEISGTMGANADRASGSAPMVMQPVAFSSKDHGADAGDIATTLRAMGHGASHANGGGQVAVAFQSKQSATAQAPSFDDVAPTLDVAKAGGMATLTTSAVRRLTPRECERLQGFPDDYTAIPWRKKPSSECPDGPRYKALGNSMAVPVMRWIGRRVANELAKRIAS